ncbi:hypothetical protein [Butyrivibrio sp. AE2005]|uniref:hypothetical protein n=1 Tax=Butyrivibrio sp. AE2005 TaxID=1496722 RepID=UPI00047A0DE7|nr:hypothetical protein [Butyrivibrio sp. AE2005]
MGNTEKLYEDYRDIAQRASDLYQEKLYKELETAEKKLKNIIDTIVQEHAKDYSLLIQNDSSKEIRLFELSSRIKGKDSLREKIIRDQIFYDLKAAQTPRKIINVLKNNMDDLIGLRYLVSLAEDCGNMLKLIAENESEFNDAAITFNNLRNNPQKMKNGRQIYRIKGTYKGYPFELQIKSKIDSAWADIEHMLFYKDFNFSYIQGTNKEVMNKIGDLLEQIDGLMLNVRNSHEEYDQKVEEMDFSQYLRTQYVNLLREKLGSSYVLTEYRKSIYTMFDKCCDNDTAKVKVLSQKDNSKYSYIAEFKYCESFRESVLHKNYQTLRNASIEFSVFESLYYEWIANCNKEGYKEINEKELEKFLREMLSSIIGEQFNRSGSETNFKVWFIDKVIEILCKDSIICKTKCFFFNKDKMDMLYAFWSSFYDRLNDKWTQIIYKEGDDEDTDTKRESIGTVVIKYMLDGKGNPLEYFGKIKKIIDESEEIEGFIFNDLSGDISECYKENNINSSGKEKPENLICLLLNASK